MNEARFCSACGAPAFQRAIDRYVRDVCTACAKILCRNPAPAAGCLVENNFAALLARRKFEPWKWLWYFPSGFWWSSSDRCSASTVISTILARTASSFCTAPPSLGGRSRRAMTPHKSRSSRPTRCPQRSRSASPHIAVRCANGRDQIAPVGDFSQSVVSCGRCCALHPHRR